MAEDRFDIPDAVRRYIKEKGYALSEAMAPFISDWWNWYTGANDWYKVAYTTPDDGCHERRRLSLRPHRRACQEWASLLLNEDTAITVQDGGTCAWLTDYLESHGFWPSGQMLVEKAFALGTGAWALVFEIGEAAEKSRILIRSYDARMILPLSWTAEGVTECAFVTRTVIDGKAAVQLAMHVLDDGEYVVRTTLFRGNRRLSPEEHGVSAEFRTGCATPTFALVRPAIENTVVDLSPYGMSVFADAADAAKSVDLTYDALFQEIELTEAIVFLSDDMIDLRDRNGRVVPVAMGDGDRKFRKLEGQDGTNLYEVYSPAIRTDPIRSALDVALAQFGDLVGFGQNYFVMDKAGGLKTATEVSSDNSALMRNIRKHENALRDAIQIIVSSLITCARIHCNADVAESFGPVEVSFDDSIVVDTQAEKSMMLAEIAAGVVPRWKYMATFYGMSDDEARAEIGSAVDDGGY